MCNFHNNNLSDPLDSLAVAGPLGFVAGSYLGGKATKAFVGEDAPRRELFKFSSYFLPLIFASHVDSIYFRNQVGRQL